MKDHTYRILAADAKESHRLQDGLWVPSGNIATVSTLHRGGLAGFGGDVYYTDAALDAIVTSAGGDAPTVGAAIYAAADRPWQAWRRIRPHLASVLPLEAWVHLHESSLEELEERRMDPVIGAFRILSGMTLKSASSRLDHINYTRQEVASAIRVAARDRLIRVAPRRVVIEERWDERGLTVTASWAALPAADRRVPDWMANGLDLPSSAAIH